MHFLLSFLAYWIGSTYFVTGLLNFFTPITSAVAIVTLLLAAFIAFCALRVQGLFEPVALSPRTSLEKVLFFGCGAVLLGWIWIVTHRVTTDTDAHVYHLPLALLMNESTWYFGIGKLNSHFGFPNGNSVLASLFSSFGVIGFENIPNLICWMLMVGGCISYLLRCGIPRYFAILVSIMIAFSPDLFWQSYNMGTDLPAAVFLALGFLSWTDQRLDRSFWFFAVAGTFKTLGQIAFVFFGFFYLVEALRLRRKLRWVEFFAVGITLVLWTRAWVGTGNPIYPALPLAVGSWSISKADQSGLIASLKAYSGISRTFSGIVQFVPKFLFSPSHVKSSIWFWPLTALVWGFVAKHWIYMQSKPRWNLRKALIIACLFLLTGIWFLGSPLFRFLAGIAIFITLFPFSILGTDLLKGRAGWIIHGVLALLLLAFSWNVLKHLRNNVIPLIGKSQAEIERNFLAYQPELISVKSLISENGKILSYTQSQSTFCGRAKSPCISDYSIGDPKLLVMKFWQSQNESK